jgi:hypothetical protein
MVAKLLGFILMALSDQERVALAIEEIERVCQGLRPDGGR